MRKSILAIGLMGLFAACGGGSKSESTTPAANPCAAPAEAMPAEGTEAAPAEGTEAAPAEGTEAAPATEAAPEAGGAK